MNVTVKDAMQISSFKECTLIAGESGIDNIILKITSMEVPDLAPWLNEGDFLITTGYSIKNDHKNLISLIRALKENKCSGLAIKTKYIGTISDDTINLCNDLSMPLIIIPNNMPHVDLTVPLSKLIIDNSIIKYEYSIEMHKKFIDLELSNKGLDGITDLLHHLLNINCYILDPSFKVLSSNDKETTPEFFINNNCTEHLLSYAKSNKLYSNIVLNEKEYIIRTIYLKSSISGYLIYIRPEIPHEILNIITDHAATTIALNFLKTNSQIDQGNRLDNILLMDIITDSITTEDEIELRTNSLKWPSLPGKIIIFDIKDFKEFSKNIQEDDIHNIKYKILEIINKNLNKLYCEYKTFFFSDNFITLINCKDENKLEEALNTIIKFINKTYELDLLVGISNSFTNYNDIRFEYDNSRNAISIGKSYIRNQITDSMIFDISKLNLENFIINNRNSPLLSDFIREYTYDLIEYDNENNTTLYKTLFTYIKLGGNTSAAARELFIHRNTMIYRINKCAEIVNMDIFNPEIQLNFYLAYKTYILINTN
ncbi:MAG: hypothetical protein GXZ08_05505 [Tissierellia bacterium]|nr:hypothetical protein [Tissierellia bacterium]